MLDVDALREVEFLEDGVFAEPALGRTDGAGLGEHQRDPLRVDFREAMDFLGDVGYLMRSLLGRPGVG
jgi:hypothetical protein